MGKLKISGEIDPFQSKNLELSPIKRSKLGRCGSELSELIKCREFPHFPPDPPVDFPLGVRDFPLERFQKPRRPHVPRHALGVQKRGQF
jgi:hypothetical protein